MKLKRKRLTFFISVMQNEVKKVEREIMTQSASELRYKPYLDGLTIIYVLKERLTN
jgi:hypothetical protein